MPLISVILPVYNAEKYIAEAVESIVNQTFTDFELIVINDASTDNTLHILQQFKDPRINLVSNAANERVVKCLNKGLSLSKGDLIARMDGDDISLPERFTRQVAYLDRHTDVDICCTWVHVFGDKNHIHHTPLDHQAIKTSLLFQNSVIHPSVMFRKKSFDELNVQYDEAFKNAEDYGLWAKLIDVLKFRTLPEVLIKYRIHDSNVSVHKASNWEVIRQINYRVYEVFLKRAGVSYTQEELEIHIGIGFRLTATLSIDHFRKKIQWLEKIVLANNESGYFDRQSLCNEVIEHIILLQRKVKKTPAVLFIILKMLYRIFSLENLKNYIPFKISRTKNYNTSLAFLDNI